MNRRSAYAMVMSAACALPLAWAGGAAPNPPAAEAPAERAGDPPRDVLPIPEPRLAPITTLDARNAKAPPRFQVKAPAGAPNVLVVLIDDMGFGQSSAFGGPIHMPTLERMAKGGLRYNKFHTTALCSPTRAALLTGRNHHVCNMGSITETATSFPGQTGQRPDSVAPLAEMLRLNGYSTAAFGKSHETAAWEVSPSGPTDRWPTRSGFDKFYGFIGGETNQWAPALYEDMSRVELPMDPKYHLMTDLADQAIKWTSAQKALTPDKPFFAYFAPGATHAPHHAPKEWIDRYKGRFDQGWDRLREETLARQIKLGVVPAGTRLAPKPEAIKDWDDLSDDEKRLFARQMEVFAGYGEYADHEVGRLIQSIEDLGHLENTLVFYMVGDNGASGEGTMNGLLNEATYFNGIPESVPEILKHIDDLGGPNSYGHYAAGWAVAGDAPFAWTKQVAGSYGGTRNGMVVHWPRRIKAAGELRSQWHHVIDVAPTILEAAGLPEPKSVNGTPQTPIEGVSMLYTFDDAGAKDRRKTQYFEIFGNRGVYHDGWLAHTVHRAAWEGKPRRPLLEDKWELYHVDEDFSSANDLAAAQPAKLKELQALFLEEAAKNQVLPLDDRTLERMNGALVGRPDLMAGRTSLTVYEGMIGMTENVFLNLKNRSHAITAELQVPKGGGDGVILAQAGRFGGWSLYVKDGKPTYVYNYLGQTAYKVVSPKALPEGRATVRFEFAYDGGGVAKGGAGSIFIDGEKVSEGRIEKTQAYVFSADEGVDVGLDGETPVTEEYKERDNAFTGRIHKVVVEVK
ncbi:arylsulfatase [Paludisphaera mucosa]|uniref:Arylsulfatase n=1 Tax=Paludisphaera mucosa TaxID=3030827 RepID=A0ABT6F4P6_9BACT|nr:arylsulfatase [Paludisphaera mucosa]MDG3002557.1 arylsulfatase [Paludisphaera mucosa]